jgi:hypothetical protein
MKRILFTIAILLAISFAAQAQSVSGPTLTLTSSSGEFHSLATVTATGRVFCSSPTFFGGPYSTRVRTSDGLVQDARTYSCTTTRLVFKLPILNTQILDITISAPFFSETIVLVQQPTLPAAPHLEAAGTVSLLVRTVLPSVGQIVGGVFTLPDPVIEAGVLFLLQGSGFGITKTYEVKFFTASGAPIPDPTLGGRQLSVIAQVFPKSSGITYDQFTFDVPLEKLPKVPFFIEAYYAGDASIKTNAVLLQPIND